MKLQALSKRLLSLLLFLSMILGLFPGTVSAREAIAPEKSATEAGKDYTATINALDRPAGAYTTFFDLSEITEADRKTWTGDFVMLVTVGGQSYAFSPMTITDGKVAAVPVTIDGNYLTFSDEAAVRNATVTLEPNTAANWEHERILVRWDGKRVYAVMSNDTPVFAVTSGSASANAFYPDLGKTENTTAGRMLYKTLNNARRYYTYTDGSFSPVAISSDELNQEYNTLYLYELTSITENLYNALQSARSYATGNGSGTYDPELYAGFVTLLEESIALYQESNHYLSTEERGQMTILRKALNTRADSLNAYMTLLDRVGNVSDYSSVTLPASLGWDNSLVDITSRKDPADYTGLDGTYFIVCISDGTLYLMDPTVSASGGTVGSTVVTASNQALKNVSADKAFDMYQEEDPTNANTNCFYFRTQDGRFLRSVITEDSPVLSLGNAHQSLGIKYAGSDRIYIYRNYYTNVTGGGYGTVKSHLNFHSTDKTFLMQKDADVTDYSNYRLYRLTWSTEALYSALQEMLPYAAAGGSGTVPGIYQDFLTCLDESMALYLRYNVGHTTEQFENTTAIQAELKAQVTRLLSYQELLSADSYAGVIENLPAPYNELSKAPLSRTHTQKIKYITGGTYYIVHRDTTGTHWAMVPDDALVDQDRLAAAEAVVAGDRVLNGQSLWAFDLKENEGYPNEILPSPTNNSTFSVSGAGVAVTNSENYLYGGFADGEQFGLGVYVHEEGFLMYTNRDFDGDGTKTIHTMTYVPKYNGFRLRNDGAANANDENLFRLYRVSSHVLELYDAIARMKVYAEGNNSEGRYPAEAYEAFLADLLDSIKLYQYYNTSLLEGQEEAQLKDTLDQQADLLLTHIQTLTLGDSQTSYIDIPVEILDFRADGFLLDYVYGLADPGAVEDKLGLERNSLKAYTLKSTTFTKADGTVIKTNVSTKLMEDTLVDGKMVYTEKTLRQYAYTLLSGVYGQFGHIPKQNNEIKRMVDELVAKADGLAVESEAWMALLGSPEDTYSKTTTPGKNGGELALEDVETAYDLAYYTLNYLWRPVPETEYMGEENLPYNLQVTERPVFRLYMDEETGYYTLDADNQVEYSGYYTYNAVPYAPSPAHRNSPRFMPADGLGFEKGTAFDDALDTDRSQYLYHSKNYSTDGGNYHFTVHAKGSFVYYEEQDLYFEFLGDDDVYFFVNGQLVLDLGGGHVAAGGTVNLNEKAASLGLEDGGVYSFDMFYAERKASASNLRFATNIQLMDPDLMTRKSQYDGTTETPLLDGAAVNVGDPVIYSFEMENRRELPVRQVAFTDATLGISLSMDAVTIDSSLSATELTDLTLFYRSIDPHTGEVYSGKTTAYTDYSEFKALLEGLTADVENSQPFLGGCSFTIQKEAQLRELLEIGIPAGCQLSLYGMVRNATEGKYVNTLTSSACPVTLDGAGNQIVLTPVYGSASRNLYGVNLEDVVIPEPLQMVLDYGKPIALPMNELWTRVQIRDGNVALSYRGLSLTGENGALRVKEPLNLFCNDTQGEKAVASGTFYLREGVPTFRLNTLMEHQERVYAVYRLSLRDTGETVAYLWQEIQLLPATMMYYETDFAEGIFTITSGDSKTVDKDGNTVAPTEPNELQDQGTVVPGDAFVKTASEEKDYENALFFDFSNTEQDKERYQQNQYQGTNYDSAGAWTATQQNNTISNIKVNTAAGTLSFSPALTYPTAEDPTSVANANHLRIGTLSYDPAYAEVMQIRLKLEGFNSLNNNPFLRLWWKGTKDGQSQAGYENAYMFGHGFQTDGTYMTITLDLTSQHPDNSPYGPYDMREMDQITWVQFGLHNFAVTAGESKVTYDYMYIGPRNNAPVQHDQNALYITFDNTDSDRVRYRYPQYNGTSPDTADWGAFHYLCDANGKHTKTIYFDPVYDSVSGTLSGKAQQAITYGNNLTFYLQNLNYPLEQAQVLEVRAKPEGMTPILPNKGRLQLWYTTSTGTDTYYPVRHYLKEGELTDGAYMLFRIPLGEDIQSDGNLTELQLSFHEFQLTANAKITIDYIYMGPEADAPSAQKSFYSPPKDDFLYFGYENHGDAQERYRSNVYNGLNFDLLQDGNAVCWDEGDNQAKPVVSVDNETGTLVVKTTADPYDSGIANNAERFYIQTGRAGASTQPLNYSPENAEICQVRLKFNGFASRDNGKYPRIQFRSHEDGYVYDAEATNCTYPLSESIPIDDRYLNADHYLTLSAPVQSRVAKAARLNTIRLDFLDLDWAEDGVPGTITVDYIYVGPADSAPDPVYGYDSSYEEDTGLSNGTSLYAEGLGVKLNESTTEYTRGEFTFTGTGFDLISRTGEQTATLRVEIFNSQGTAVKRMTVNTKGELELYQIPVVSVQGLAHGTYHVTIDVYNKVNAVVPILSRGNQFYFDAVRIYDPMDTTADPLSGEVLNDTVAHLMDREDRSHIKEIRNILLSADSFSALTGSQAGALFIDSYKVPEYSVTDPETGETVTTTIPGLEIHQGYAMDVLTYSKVGPKNEVYLDPGQAVAFKLEVDSGGDPKSLLPIRLDVGAKTITGAPATLVAAVVSGNSSIDSGLTLSTRTVTTLSTCTALYRPLTLTRAMLAEENGRNYCYVVLYNATDLQNVTTAGDGTATERTGDYVISLTDIKVTYVLDPYGAPEDSPADPEIRSRKSPAPEAASRISFLVDGNTTRAAAKVIGEVMETPLLKEGPGLMHSLNLASDISINYVVSKGELASYDSFWLECRIPGQDRTEKIAPVEKGDYYYFTLQGLTAVEMGDTVEATLYMEKKGRTYYWETDFYSVAQYAYGQMAKDNASRALKTLCADLLRYGAAAQTYKGYRTKAPADGSMTEAQKALLTDLSALSFGNTNRELPDLTEPTVKWVGKALVLDSKVTVRFIADLTAYRGSREDLTLRVTYRDMKGEEQTVTLREAKAYGTTEGRYSYDFSALLAPELRTTLKAAFYAGETQVSNTLEYSVDTYGNNKTGTLETLCRALLAYSDSAKAYFAG